MKHRNFFTSIPTYWDIRELGISHSANDVAGSEVGISRHAHHASIGLTFTRAPAECPGCKNIPPWTSMRICKCLRSAALKKTSLRSPSACRWSRHSCIGSAVQGVIFVHPCQSAEVEVNDGSAHARWGCGTSNVASSSQMFHVDDFLSKSTFKGFYKQNCNQRSGQDRCFN